MTYYYLEFQSDSGITYALEDAHFGETVKITPNEFKHITARQIADVLIKHGEDDYIPGDSITIKKGGE